MTLTVTLISRLYRPKALQCLQSGLGLGSGLGLAACFEEGVLNANPNGLHVHVPL